MKNKKWLLLLIIAFPSLFWVILESSSVNSHRLNYYGPKTANGKDTVFYKVPVEWSAAVKAASGMTIAEQEETKDVNPVHLNPDLTDTANFPVYVVMFVKEQYSNESYRMSALWEYMSYKAEKIKDIPFLIVTEQNNNKTRDNAGIKKMFESKNVWSVILPDEEFQATSKNYFKEKPYYVDYSYFAMIDRKRHIRGYYDGRYASEIKRMIDEYRHLRLKEEKQKMINENEIKTK